MPRSTPGKPATELLPSTPETGNLPDLVNQLARELAESRRALAAAQQRLGTTSRTLDGRTQELTEARTALSLLLCTLDSTTDGILAMGYFGRAMHYNSRFIQMWRLPEDKLAHLNEAALLTMQLAQVRNPQQFLNDVQQRKTDPDRAHSSVVELTDGRILECHVMPQRVGGRRIGVVTSFHDATERERLGRVLSALEAEMPLAVAEAKASTW